jgi:hypothetical protein
VIVGLWIGSGSTRSTAWYSANGRDWAQAATSLAGFDAIGVAGLDGKIVAVGTDLGDANSGQAASWSSSDGLTWTKSTAPTDVPVAALDSVARVGTSLIACGAPNVSPTSVQQAGPTLPGSTPRPSATELLWVSEDGVNWVPITSSAAPVDNARLVAMGNRVSMIGGSSNGATANSGDLVLGPKRPPVAGSASANFALSVKAASLPMIPDVSKGYTLGPVTTTKDHFYTFATGPSGTSIFNSTSGSLWSRQIKPAGLTATGATGETLITGRPVVLAAVPDGKSGIIAAGKVTDASGDNGMIWHMTQVGKWNQVAFEDDTPPEFSSIAAGPTGFVASSDAAGGSPIMYSTDGNDWRAGAINVGSGLALSVATYHYGFVAVGSDPGHQGASTAWTSPDGRTWTMRTDWHLPPTATALVGMGYGLVVAAKTATPGSTASPTPSPTPGASPSSSASPKATPKATPKPTGAPKPTTTTWWWSPTGGSWQQSGITTSGGNWAIANNQFLVFDAPTTVNNDWTAWTSSDGRNWKHPSGNAVNFPGSKTCVVASRGNVIVIVSWQSSGVLKGYFGSFVGH